MTSLLDLSDALQQLVSRVSPAVVGVEQGRGAGTGVVVATDGYLLTNHHVAGNGKALGIRLPGGETTRGELVGSDGPRVRVHALSRGTAQHGFVALDQPAQVPVGDHSREASALVDDRRDPESFPTHLIDRVAHGCRNGDVWRFVAGVHQLVDAEDFFGARGRPSSTGTRDVVVVGWLDSPCRSNFWPDARPPR